MATIKYWDGSAWQYAVVGKQGPVGPTGPTGPAGQASLQRFRFVATGGQTSVSGTDANGNTLAYTPGLEEVFINGAAQVRGQDYTATNGTSITGITALIAGDVVEIYAWGVFNVANTIPNTLIDAKGDILAGTGADSVGRLAVGANNTVLTADSATATGLKWAAAAGGEQNWSIINSGGTVLTGATTITISGISGKDKIMVLVGGASADAEAVIGVRFNSNNSNVYYNYGLRINATQNYASSNYADMGVTTNLIQLGALSLNTASTISGYVLISGCNTNGVKVFNAVGGSSAGGSNNNLSRIGGGYFDSSSQITSVSIVSNSGNFDNGNVWVYASA